MYYERFFKKVIPIVIVSALVFAFLIIHYQESDKTQQTQIIPEHSNDKTLTDNLKNIQQPAMESLANDSYLKKLQNDDIQLTSKRADVMAKVPVIKWQSDLIANIRSEDINQTIKNIPNFDDAHLATSSMQEGFTTTSATSQNTFVTRLTRVRKLYAIAKNNPNLIIPDLKKIHQDSLTAWPDAAKKHFENYDKGQMKLSEPDAFMKYMSYCLVATYLLAEFGDYDSLPLLSRQYKIDRLPLNKFPAPVAPATTFYAMHRLASTYPSDRLSPEALKALDEYLNASKEFVPSVKQIEVTVWDSYYVESDPRVSVLGLKDEIIKSQKTIIMPLYPTRFIMKDIAEIQTENGDLDPKKSVEFYSKLDHSAQQEFYQTKLPNSIMSDENGVKSRKLDELFNKLDAFVQFVYPSQVNSSQ
jgi:hypothetical protein